MKHFLSILPLLTLMFLLTADSALAPFKPASQVLPYPYNLVICSGFSANGNGRHSSLHCVTPVTPEVNSLPAPELMKGIGYSDLKITTASEEAQQYFSQGMALIYDFWFFEAYRAFKHASRLDPDAAMPHFGMALSFAYSTAYDDYESQQRQAIRTADSLAIHASEKERDLIHAIKAFALDQEQDKRTGIFMDRMQEVTMKHPEDVDAKLLLWLKGNENGYTASGNPKKNTIMNEFLLRDLLKSHPEHPGVNHFWIHQMEDCCPEQALTSAAILPSLAPNSGHMVHMPGHIYFRLGHYEKAREAFLASLVVDSAYMVQQNIPSISVWNYHHNLHFLIANSLEQGRFKEAEKLFERNSEIGLWPAKTQENLKMMTDFRNFFYSGVSQADLLFRLEKWEKAVEVFQILFKNEDVNQAPPFYFGLMFHTYLRYAKGMLALKHKQISKAKWELNAMDIYLKDLMEKEPQFSKKNASLYNEMTMYSFLLKAAIAAKKPSKIRKAETYYKEALKAQQRLEYQEPPKVWRLVSEDLGWFYLDQNMPGKALESFETALGARPDSGFLIFGLAEAARLKGDREKAEMLYEDFLRVWKYADENLPQISIARSRIQELKKKD